MIKKILIGLLALSMTACSKSTQQKQEVKEVETINFMERAESFASGDGSSSSPYIINSADQLELLADICDNNIKDDELNMTYFERKPYYSAHYQLDNDIMVNDIDTLDAWDTSAPTNRLKSIVNFEGTFDGNNHSISGLYMTDYYYRDNTTTTGLFGVLNNATIKNLVIGSSYVDTKYDGSAFISEARNTTIDNCHTKDVTISSKSSGMIVAKGSNCTIQNCSSKGTIKYKKDSTDTGGIAGHLFEGNVENCKSCVTFMPISKKANSSIIGGIIGEYQCYTDDNEKNNYSIKDCHYDGKVSGKINSFGGITGAISYNEAENKIVIESCSNASKGTFEDCSGTIYLGGICGNILGCKQVSSTKYKGATLKFVNNINNANIKVDDNSATVGGIIGYGHIEGGSIHFNKCKNNGNMHADGAGGIVGDLAIMGEGTMAFDGDINEGKISGNCVGGLGNDVTCAPWNDSNKASLILKNCESNGEIVHENATAGALFGSFMPGLEEDNPIGKYEVSLCTTTSDLPYFGRTDSIQVLARKFAEALVKEFGKEKAAEIIKKAFPDI